MKENYTDITIVLDKSASMHRVWSDTLGGFNKFLKDQKEVEGEATITLYQFADDFSPIYEGKRIKTAEELTAITYLPNGFSTSLLDAIGIAITETGKRLDSMDEDEKPEKVIFVVQTDGLENSSQEHTVESVRSMIEHQESNYNWKFIFLGASPEAFSQAGNLGINSLNSMQYSNTAKGNDAAYSMLSKSVGKWRGMDTIAYSSAMAFSEEDKEAVKNEE
jgi:hypothetical protein